MGYDTVIRGGSFVDGTRLPRYNADVGIKDGRVAKIGRIDDPGDARVLDAHGCIVAPGFVDLHTHYDAQLHWDPYCTISGWHGVTSVSIGNCGFGFAPCRPEDRDRAMLLMTRTEQVPYETMKEGMPWKWETFPEWMENLENIPKGVNVITYTPVNPLLIYVMGSIEDAKSRACTKEEQKEMQRLLNEAMEHGALGFSIQRLGENSVQADYDGTPMPTDTMCDEDILVLADVLRERDEGFIQITQASGGDPLRSGEAVFDSDKDFLERLAGRAQRPVLHNSIAASDTYPNFHRSELEWIRKCNDKGLRIYVQGANIRQWFQFTMDLWNLYDLAPAWKHATLGTFEERLAKMADPELRQGLRDEEPMLSGVGEQTRPHALTIKEIPGYPELEKKYVGKKVGEIAEAEGKHVVDAMLDICVASNLKAVFRSGDTLSADPVKVGEVMRNQYTVAGMSDGGAHTKFVTAGSFTTDFLTWLVRDTQELTLEEAHYHLSYLPAQAAGFLDRGFLREGAPADIVVYDLERLKRVPDWDYEVAYDMPAGEWRMIQRSEGYKWTLVNGVITFEETEEGQQCTGATPGHLLRFGRDTLQA